MEANIKYTTTSQFRKIKEKTKNRPLVSGFIVVIILLIIFFFFKNGQVEEKTLTLVRGDFVQSISVSGRVVAAERVDLVFSGSGRISAVYADVGDEVRSGSVLAELENGDAYADILQKEASYEAARASLNSLLSGTRDEQIAISESSVAAAEVTLEQDRQTLLDELEEAFVLADDAVRHRVDQFMENPETNPNLSFVVSSSLEVKIESKRLLLEGILDTWNGESSLVSADDVLLYADTVTSRLYEIRSFLTDIADALNSLSAGGEFSQTTIDAYKADVVTARTNINSALSSITSAVTSVRDSEATLVTKERTLLLEKAGATTEEIEEAEAGVKAARADLERARAQYRKTLVVAPFDGIVTKMDARVGGSASSNTSDISMISADTLQVESFVPEINAPLLEIGDSAIVTLDAYGERVPFSAQIISLDPAETLRDGVSTYRTILEFVENDTRIRSGMTANIVITTEEKEDVLAVPQGIVKIRDGEAFVDVREGETIISRKVTTGSVSSLGTIEILSGLKEGDVVILK